MVIIYLAMQGIQVPSLVRELESTFCRATNIEPHSKDPVPPRLSN